MQTFLFLCHGESSGPGSNNRDSTIESSGLTALIKQTFADIVLPPDIGGSTKLQQHRNNPDAFDLYFSSNLQSEAYNVGGTYTAPDIAVFERSDFEDFADTEHLMRRRLQEFARRLLNGELQPAKYE